MVHFVKEPGRADARRNRQAILDAARVEFAERGVDAQIDRVAERAGVGVGTIYRHFATKDALLAELVREQFLVFGEQARDALDADGPAFERFATVLTRNAETMADDAGTRFAVTRGGDGVWARAADIRDELVEMIRPLIAQAKAEGDLRADFEAEEIGVLMSGLCATMDAKPGVWRRQLEILLDGLRAR